MFANTQMMGMDLAFPDVVLTPPVMAPIPYPNVAMGPMGVPAAYNVLYLAMPAHNLLTMVPLSMGDLPGTTGVASGITCGPARHLTAAFTVFVGLAPGTRLTSASLQNLTNAPGARIVPSQTKILLLAP
jgi:hypothetical protein